MDILFKQLVDSTKPSLDLSLVEDLTSLYKHYGIKYENSLTLYQVQKHLYENIQDNLIGNQLYRAQLFIVKDQLLLTHFIKSEKLQPYLGIIEIVIDGIRSRNDTLNQSIPQLVSLEYEDKWRIALQSAWDLTVISPQKLEYNLQDLERRYRRQFVVSNSAKILQSEGCEVHIEDGRVLIDESQARNVANRIEGDIRLLGGIEALKKLFELIKPCHNENQGRYHLGRTFNSLIQADFPSIPFAYLLNLSVKYPRKQILVAVESPNKIWKRILNISIPLTSILDVQAHNQFALLFHSTDTILYFLQELAVYDNLFCLIQLRPSDVPKMIQGLFSGFSETIQQNLGWTPEQAAIIAERILKLAEGKLYPITFHARQIYNLNLNIGKDEIDKILTVYSHGVSSVNSNFHIPQDLSQISPENHFQHKPLIRLSKDEYLLTSSSICSPAFYEAIVSELRAKVDSKINDKLGDKIEYFIKGEFSRRGIKFNCGKYRGTKKDKIDEIDIVVETSDTLIFFEVKAKALTRRSRCGSDLNLLFDLSDSLLTSQIQINKHEIYIRKNGSISLENDSICDLNNRDIARISVTLLDFGSFQDRTILFQFLENMLLGKVEASDDVNKVKKLNDKLDEFRLQFNELIQIDPIRANNPFYNCWFLSVPQLLILLDNVNSSDDLKRELWRTRSITTSSLDFYREYEYARQLAAARDSM
ncbi:YraN family protein [Nostoc sp. CHAB 5824]|nr:YraN family protein [Nostoc sp. CHAB 5824]